MVAETFPHQTKPNHQIEVRSIDAHVAKLISDTVINEHPSVRQGDMDGNIAALKAATPAGSPHHHRVGMVDFLEDYRDGLGKPAPSTESGPAKTKVKVVDSTL